jgi:hypothetical protein
LNEAAPESVEEALARARQHGRAAAAEGLAALQALAEAGGLSLGTSLDEGAIATLRETIQQVRRWLDPEGGRSAASVLEGVSQALDEEIQRWEEKSREDSEARTILRAFLAVREVVWEFASRGSDDGGGSASPAPTGPRRVPIEG